MNREIIFRGYNENFDKWLYGSLIVDAVPEEHFDGNYRIVVISGQQPYDWYNVVPKSVGQFTGLKDNTGKNIYEGDVIKINCKDCRCETGIVIWDENYGRWDTDIRYKGYIGDGYLTLKKALKHNAEVSSNVYETLKKIKNNE